MIFSYTKLSILDIELVVLANMQKANRTFQMKQRE